jgi:hypothetical protein
VRIRRTRDGGGVKRFDAKPPAPGFEGERPKRKPRSAASRSRASFALACEKARAVLKAVSVGDTEVLRQIEPGELVGLYALLHTHVYGVEPGELTEGTAFAAARSAATKLMRDLGGPLEAVGFVRWTWKREAMREKRRREEGAVTSFRLGWRLQFVSRVLVADYRVAQARAGGVHR